LKTDSDLVNIDANSGVLSVEAKGESLQSRPLEEPDLTNNHTGMGRELFGVFRKNANGAEMGASIFSVSD
jgi:phosphogluconate dehydratase